MGALPFRRTSKEAGEVVSGNGFGVDFSSEGRAVMRRVL
jgi:hypothetical protein